jgi:peptide deformylase
MVLPIIILPNPQLRIIAQPVLLPEISDASIQNLCDAMITTMHHDDGIGLAAPQVAQSIRIIAIGTDAFKDHTALPFLKTKDLILINPEITEYSWKTEIDDEGCLSVPGFGGSVERHIKISVTAITRDGESISFVAQNYFARVIQHEIDHLNGVLYIDRAKEVWKHEKEMPL